MRTNYNNQKKKKIKNTINRRKNELRKTINRGRSLERLKAGRI